MVSLAVEQSIPQLSVGAWILGVAIVLGLCLLVVRLCILCLRLCWFPVRVVRRLLFGKRPPQCQPVEVVQVVEEVPVGDGMD